MTALALDTKRAATTDALAEAWHATGIKDGDHPLRACHPQSQADVWSDVAQWVTRLAGRRLPLDGRGVDPLAEAMHADCGRAPDRRPHALAACDSAALRESTFLDAAAVIAWLTEDPARTTGAV